MDWIRVVCKRNTDSGAMVFPLFKNLEVTKIYHFSSKCEILSDICKDCIEDHCAVCTAKDFPEVCETCNLEEELDCTDCELTRNACIDCSEVKDCDYRR